jgi:Na+/pantothenate symporter
LARRILLLWLALNALAFIFAGQSWWVLQIITGDQTLAVTGSGFDTDRSISAILLFGLTALLFVSFSRGWAAVAISALASAASLLLAGLLLVGFVSQNIGGVAAVVEKQTAITVLPLLGQNEPNQISGELQAWAWFALTVIILLAIAQAFFAIKTRSWSKTRVSTVDRTEAKKRRSISGDEPEDAIAIWDSQR